MSDRIERIEGAAETFLRDGDVLANQLVFPTAQAGQTVSDDVATLDQPTDACRVCVEIGEAACWFLGWAVQRDHCAETLSDDPVPWTVYPRAAFWFVLAPVSIAIVAGRLMWMRFASE